MLPLLPGGFSVERIIAIVLILAAIFYLSIRVRKYFSYLRESGGKGFGASLVVLGAMLFVVAWSGFYKLFTLAISAETFEKISLWLIIIGVGAIVVDWLLQKMRKKQLLGLEDERRDYITRVKKGIKNEDAERIALAKVKQVSNPPGLKMIASQLNREKIWEVFMKDSIGHYYKVSLDVEGEVQGWEQLDSLPEYMIGTF